jgi:transcriptional activator SPT8
MFTSQVDDQAKSNTDPAQSFLLAALRAPRADMQVGSVAETERGDALKVEELDAPARDDSRTGHTIPIQTEQLHESTHRIYTYTVAPSWPLSRKSAAVNTSGASVIAPDLHIYHKKHKPIASFAPYAHITDMGTFDDDMDPTAGSGEEDEDEDMEDVNDPNDDQDQDQDQEQDDEDEDDDNDDNDNDEDDEGDQDEPDTPSRRASQPQRPSSRTERPPNPAVVLTSPSPRGTRSPAGAIAAPFVPPIRAEALSAQAYDIVPTMAAPQSTSINAIAATPDMRWVFSGGTDGYVRMYNWMDTVNGKVPLTVAQKHPFVDSVMKAGSLVTYWENEEATVRTPPGPDEGKWTSPVYSLAVQNQAVWLLSGLESGGINLQTCRHQAGTRITTLKEHTSAVSVLSLSQDETGLLSGSWDKTIHDWDLNTGKVRRSFRGAGGQISAIEMRPMSDLPVPEVVDSLPEPVDGTFSSNNDAPFTNGDMLNGLDSKDGDEDAMGSPTGSLFGEDHGSLFGEETGNGGGGGSDNVFGDDDDELTRALTSEMQEDDASGEIDAEMTGMGSGGPVQPPGETTDSHIPKEDGAVSSPSTTKPDDQVNGQPTHNGSKPASPLTNGLPHSDEPLTAPPTNEEEKSASDLPPQSESIFLDASQDGTLRIWDRRMQSPIATIVPQGGTPPWCTGACWSPDGNFFYAGRRNCSVDEYSIHHLGSKRSEANRNFKFQAGSGPVYAVRAMPNKRHLVW